MILLDGHSLNRKSSLRPEAMGLTLEERNSTATLTLGPDAPEISINDWLLDDTEPGAGIVWRVKTISENVETETRTVNLEHVIQSLKDRVLFGETKTEKIAGIEGAAAVSARSAINYALARQNEWKLGDLAQDPAKPYSFNGENLFAVLETVTASIGDVQWEYDLTKLPFTVHVRKIPSGFSSEMRMSRNISTLRHQIDRSRMYTRIYPIGKDNLHLSGEYLSKNESLWGIVCRVETDQSKETEESLRDWAQERLNRHCEPAVTITISGTDLSRETGESLDNITLGRRCRVPLPEKGTTITERVTRLSWTDKIKEPRKFTVTLANTTEDVASIVNRIQEAVESGRGGGGRYGASKNEEDHAWFVDTSTHVGMIAEAVAGPGSAEDWSRVASVIVDGEGIHQRVVRTEGDIVAMWASIEVLEDRIVLEVANAKSDTYSKIEQTASSIRSEVNSDKSTLFSAIMQTATNIYTQVGNAKSDTYSKIEQTASSIRSEVNSSKSTLYSTIMQTATNIYTQVGNAKSDTYSKIEQTASSITTTVRGKVGKDEVISCINQTPESITISASKVSISGTTKINDVFTVISNAVGVSVPLICSGNVDISSNKVLNLYTATFQGSSPVTLTALTLAGAIKSASVDGNTLTLTPFIGDPINFSKATSLSGEWSSGHLTVTASPQNKKYNQYIISGDIEDVSEDENSWYVPILAKTSPNASTSERTGHRVAVSASGRYNAGKSAGYSNAAGNMSWPGTISGATVKASADIGYPTSSGGTGSRTLELTRDSGGAYVKLGGSLILRIR